jgi:hypothetical protein
VYVGLVDSPMYWATAILRSADAGATWEQRRIIGDFLPRAFSVKDSTLFIYALYSENNLSKNAMLISNDCGVSWDSIKISLWRGANAARLAVTANALHLVREIGIAGYVEVLYLRSSDFGYSWSKEDTLSTNDFNNSYNPGLVSGSEEKLFLIYDDQKYGGDFSGTVLFRKSNDEGNSWTQESIVSQLATAIGGRIDIDGKLITIAWSTDYITVNSARLRISEDEGKTWSPIIGFNPDSVLAGDVSVATSNSRIYTTWWDRKDREVYYRRGNLMPTSVKNETTLPNQFSLFQNYPNPFNNNTIISFTLPRKEGIILQVYDIGGRYIKTLFEGEKIAGTHTLNFSSVNLASGTYFVMLRTESSKPMIRKIVLIK